jgi:hypothetical protein
MSIVQCHCLPLRSHRAAIDQLQKCIEEWRRRYPVPLDAETLKKLRDREEIVTPDFDELEADWPK